MKLAKQEQVIDVQDREEIISPPDAAFQILDMMYDPEEKKIFGRIYALDTEAGREMKYNIDMGKKCFISQSNIEMITDRERANTNILLVKQKMRFIRGGWRISFDDETVPEGSGTEIEGFDGV
jgi:hypothetical protein